MADISIGDNHKDLLTRLQHILEWLNGERARLEQEYTHVLSQGQRAEQELRAFLHQSYGVEPGAPFTLNVEQGVITIPESPVITEASPDGATAPAV